MKKLLLLLPFLSLISCVQPLAQPQPVPTKYKAKIQAKAGEKLLDPASAQYTWSGTPYQAKSSAGMVYYQNFSMNAKNAYGGYTGFKQKRAMFNDGNVKFIYDGWTYGSAILGGLSDL